MSIELFDVMFLIEDGRHVPVVGVRRSVIAGILVTSQVQRKINHTLLAVKILFLKMNFISILT
jgi:hypothetical protein